MTENDLRDSLQKESSIWLRRRKGDSEYFEEEFLIGEKIGQGSCAICYQAELVSERCGGTLKELYPMDSESADGMHFDMERRYTPEKKQRFQVFSKESSRNGFLQLRRDFCRAYDCIHYAKQINSDLNDYIPAFEIYEGIPDPNDSENYTLYVWTPNDPSILRFDRFLQQVCDDTKQGENCAHNLDIILRAIKDLTRSIKALHCIQLLHLDINPKNFGVRLYDKKPKSSITLFDINSVFSKDGHAPTALGTDGFRSPELADCNIDEIKQTSDFYSIGATLFYSVVINNGENVKYSDDKYDDIALYLKSSELFNSYADDADEIQNVILQSQLIKILKQCLNRNLYLGRDDRDDTVYKRPTPLIEDLDEAIRTLNFISGGKSLSRGSRVVRTVIKDKQDALNEEIPTGSTGAIQWLLYQHPLYDYTADGKIDILVLGAGTYATKFLDLALEMSQIKDCYANITVASNDIQTQKKTYLDNRPEFPNYFDIDGEKARKAEEPYGTLNFISAEFSEEWDLEQNQAVLDSICRKNPQSTFSYVFIALHSDRLNYTMMNTCYEYFRDRKTLVSFVLFGDMKKDSRKKEVVFNPGEFKANSAVRVCPVDVKNTLSKQKDYDELKRMAFNIHLLWTGTLSDIRSTQTDFKKPYNFNSSISSALSVKYKLHSLDETFDFFADPVAGAREAKRRLSPSTSENKKNIRSLVMYEHRRWIVNMISDSWKCLEDFSSLKTGTKNKRKKLHPCLQPSEESWTLETEFWRKKENWDTASDAEIEKLDPLDAMSIRMHRHFDKLAQAVRPNDFIEYVRAIRLLIAGKDDLENRFNAYVTALNQLVYHRKINSYSYYLSSFKKLLKGYDDSVNKKEISDYLDLIEEKLFPVHEALAYTDWKAKDRTIVENIPFILSFSSDIRLCVPFIAEGKNQLNNDGLFQNAASSLMLNPASVTYIADFSAAANDFESFQKSVCYAVNTMDAHGLQTKIEFLFLRSYRAVSYTAEMKQSILELSPRIRRVDCFDYCERPEHTALLDGELSYCETNVFAVLKKVLEENYHSKKRFTAIESNDTKISGYLSCCDIFPSYSFDAKNQRFDTGIECRHFSYLPDSFKPYLTIEDMFRFKGKLCTYKEPEMQQDYEYFWKLYKTENPGRVNIEKNELVWKLLCSVLSDHAEQEDKLLEAKAPASEKENFEEHIFILPVLARPGVEKLLHELGGGAVPFFAEESYIEEYTSQSIRLHAFIRKSFRQGLGKLLSNPYYLTDASQLTVFRRKGGGVCVSFNNLMVSGLTRGELAEKFTEKELLLKAETILQQLADKGYLVNFRKDYAADEKNTTISFCYSSPQIKQLLTNEGRLLELYVYYSVLDTGYFDEVRSGMEIRWNDKNLTNELDLVLVKGFKTMIIECKARKEILQDYYNKLFAIGMNFGLNNQCLLVIDALELPNRENEENEMQNTRGSEYKIIDTIKDSASIKKIGVRLKEKMIGF